MNLVRKTHWRQRGIAAVTALFTGVGAIMGGAQVHTFSNGNPVTAAVGGPASPYPSTITVSRVGGSLSRLTVTLKNVTHEHPDDLDVLLVGPGGEMALLMSDAGGATRVSGVELTFVVDGPALLPDNGPLATGTFRPTDFAPADSLPVPAPPGPYATDLSVFSGTAPDGVWQLFVYDDATQNGGGGLVGGWQLTIDNAEPAAITSQPRDQTVAPGETAEFTVGVSGTPPFGYQWLRNSQVIVPFGQGGPTLTLEDVQSADAGFYSVVVTNSANPTGATSEGASLQVTGPFALVDGPADVTVDPGGVALFRVTAAGDPPLNYQWRLNGALLPDQTGPELMLENLQAGDGGNYSVTVWNADDVATTLPALLLVNAATHPTPADDFGRRPTVQGIAGIMQGDSTGATSERDEPVLLGGGKTVWAQWLAPASGVVTLTARGSAFDTLLSVFVGEAMSELALVTSDDDQGGFHTSRIQFNATEGTAYQWMLDGLGFGGSGGNFTLSWALDTEATPVPVIVSAPQPQGVQQGGEAMFSVRTGSTADRFQWYFNGEAIENATGPELSIPDVQSQDVGMYFVEVIGAKGNIQRSPFVPLQMGFLGNILAEDKVEYNSNRPSQGVPISVGLGETGWNQFPAQAGGGQGDPNPCNTPFFKTLFQLVHAEDDGVIRIDTEQSDVFVLLGVYEGAVSFLTNQNQLVACDVISGPDGLPCALQFQATQSSNYTAVVAPLQGGGNDSIRVTATMGAAPPIAGEPQCVFVPDGANHVLNVPPNAWTPSPVVQWRFNGVDIPGATNLSLNILDFNAGLAGTYSVVMSNFVSTATNAVAHVAQSGAPVLVPELLVAEGQTHFVVRGSGDQPFALESAPEPVGPWTSVATNPDACLPLWYTNFNVLPTPHRMFRAVHWSPPIP